MRTLVLDFETHYDKDYSLKNMTTTQYIRDPRFRVLGVAVAAEGGEKYIDNEADIRSQIEKTDWSDVCLVSHNCQFDAAILWEAYGVRPARFACTMFMARYLIASGVFPSTSRTNLKDVAAFVGMVKGDIEKATAAGELAEYALQDARICLALYDKFYNEVPQEEQDYIDAHIKMAACPMLELDEEPLKQAAGADKAIEEFFPLVRSDEKFTQVLLALGITPQYKTTEKGNTKLALSKKDPFMLELTKHSDPLVRLLADIRLKSKATNERNKSQRFLDTGSPLPVPLLYYGAHTGRASGQDKLNLQNMKRGGAVRSSVIAPAGHKLVIVDSAQVEARVLAWLAGEETLLAAFREGKDPYALFACDYLYPQDYEAFRAAVKAGSKTEKGQRQVAKSAVLGLGFGMGGNGFDAYCKTSGCHLDTPAQQVVNIYRRAFPQIVRYWDTCYNEVVSTGRQVLPSGRVIIYNDMRQEGSEVTYSPHNIFSKVANTRNKIWGGLATENKVQAVARDIVFWQVMQLNKLNAAELVLMVHDEGVFIVKDSIAETFKEAAEAMFKLTPTWAMGCPVSGEAVISEGYTK